MILRTPQPSSVRDTYEPRVPAPSSRHLQFLMASSWTDGATRHFISFKFRSTAWSASLWSSMNSDRSTVRDVSFPASLRSHPVTLGMLGASAGGCVEPAASEDERSRTREPGWSRRVCVSR